MTKPGDVLSGKTVALGVTGGIAAYKAAEVLRELTRRGADVQVIMTANAQRFVSALTFEALSHQPVIVDMWEGTPQERIEHIELANRIDGLVVVPATANIIGKFANGIADDFLSTFYTAVHAPVVVAPAMNTNMLHHPAVRANLNTLAERGVVIVDPEVGELACETVGEGKLAAVEVIVEYIAVALTEPKDLAGLRVLITAGPTEEPLDPVRFLTNRSSGKMGYALAQAARRRGAAVTLISGPVALDPPPGVHVVGVRTTEEMLQACLKYLGESDVVIKAAAVADFRPLAPEAQKMKRAGGHDQTVALQPNPDILAVLGSRKGHRITVGFAAETEDVVANATKKLKAKNADLMVANDVSRSDIGFGQEANEVTICFADGRIEPHDKMDKLAVAHIVLDAVVRLRDEQAS
ncbi:MAG: bifunctional phosphopantothenoylcysteine decarboxylase/phosphopantothenate--cysteine ligase CoaBC [Candidatus Tectimicrobiota bacterium]